MTIMFAIAVRAFLLQNSNSQFADVARYRAAFLSPIGRSKILGKSRFEIRISRLYIRDDLFRWPYKQCAE